MADSDKCTIPVYFTQINNDCSTVYMYSDTFVLTATVSVPCHLDDIREISFIKVTENTYKPENEAIHSFCIYERTTEELDISFCDTYDVLLFKYYDNIDNSFIQIDSKLYKDIYLGTTRIPERVFTGTYYQFQGQKKATY